MNRFPNILGEILNIEEENNDDLDMLYAATRRSEGFSQGRIRSSSWFRSRPHND